MEWLESEGMAEDLNDTKWKDEEYRLKNIDHVITILQRWTKMHTTRELFELGQRMHFPWAPVVSPQAVVDCPQHRARRFFSDTLHIENGPAFRLPRLPYRFSSQSMCLYKREPSIGENNGDIFGGELGLSEKELKRLSDEKVI